MKVLMIAPTQFFADRGCHIRILEEIRALKRLGHKLELLTYHSGEDPCCRYTGPHRSCHSTGHLRQTDSQICV